MKAFGTMARVYNPAAEMPLKKKLGKWRKVDRHVCCILVRDETACYERVGDKWRQYIHDKQTNSFHFHSKRSIDIRQCHPIEGKVAGDRCYTHMTYNMTDISMVTDEMKQNTVEIDEITPDFEGTKIYSDGSAKIEERRGACAAIVNTKRHHFASLSSLHKDQAKNSYQTELEGLYLGTRIAAEAGSKDTQWEY